MNEIATFNPVEGIIEPLLILGLFLSVIFVLRVLYIKLMLNREYSRIVKVSMAMSNNVKLHSCDIPKFEVSISAMNSKELEEIIADKNQSKKIKEKAQLELKTRRV